MNTKIESFKSVFLSAVFFLTLVVFLPFTQEQFTTSKWYFVGFAGLALILISLVQLAISKRISWVKKPADAPFFLFLVAVSLSIVFMSPNKVQAIFQPNFGLLTFVFLFIFYLFLSRAKKLPYIGLIFAVFSCLFAFSLIVTSVPFITSHIPFLAKAMQQISYFSPAGSLIDALFIVSFSAVILLGAMLKQQKENKGSLLAAVGFVLNAGAFLIVFFTLIRNQTLIVFPPLSLSWYGAVETLKQPLTALFGVGVDNFSVMFAKVKDFNYNQSVLWQIPTFSVSRSAILHIFTEAGLVGLVAFALILFRAIKQAFGVHGSVEQKLMAIFFVGAFLLFPPSFLLFFVFFCWMGITQMKSTSEEKTLDLTGITPVYLGILIFGLVIIGVSGFALGKMYSAEVIFNKALKTNNLKDVYEDMREAAMIYPYNERYRSNFAQVNLLIANNVAQQAQSRAAGQKDTTKQQTQLTDQEQQTISQAVQAAIEEGKAVASLNSQKAANWELLASIYRNIIGVAQGADTWTVSAYQRAIVLDPQNPNYRVELGGVLYVAKNYDEALKMFEQAVTLKPDWANAQYNYGWAAFQKGDYQLAANAMQNTLSLLDKKKDASDYEHAAADLETFKAKLPKTEDQTKAGTPQTEQNKLTLPTATGEVEPKLELPKTASPEAK